jgi:hypothetical protein
VCQPRSMADEMPQPISCLLRGELTSLPKYLQQRQAAGTLVHEDEVHGTFRLGPLAAEVLKHPACESPARGSHLCM